MFKSFYKNLFTIVSGLSVTAWFFKCQNPSFRAYKYVSMAVLSSVLLYPLSHAKAQVSQEIPALATQPALSLQGQWITELDGTTMLDPQTSGLIANQQGWWTVSDASADASQIQRLHLIDKERIQVVEKFGPMRLTKIVEQSCFASYLANKPDYEAMVFHPLKNNSWILVTEDATRGDPLSADCKRAFAQSGSTEYPTLLVEVSLEDEQLLITGVRAIQFDERDQVGNFPNDGIEGLAVGRNKRLFLGLEKDAKGQPRVFYVDITNDFFTDPSKFSLAHDAELMLPRFKQGNHPINGMDIYFPNPDSEGFLIAAARNDNEIWIIDLSKTQSTKIVPVTFYAPGNGAECPKYHKMDNASLEGVAVDGNNLVLINDPWRTNYLKNATCQGDKALYERMSPLIFKTPIEGSWLLP